MDCRECGEPIGAGKQFCTQCGAAVQPQQADEQPHPAPKAHRGAGRHRGVGKNRKTLWIALSAFAAAALVLALLGAFGVLTGGGSESPALAYEPVIEFSQDGHFSVLVQDGATTDPDDTKYYLDGVLYKDMRTTDFMDEPHTLEVIVYDMFGCELGIVKLEGLMIIDTSIDDTVRMDDYARAKHIAVYDPVGLLDLRSISRAGGVETLTLAECAGISDMDDIGRFAHLKGLVLAGIDIRDLDGLKKAAGLRSLLIADTEADGFEFLEDMAALESLTLLSTNIASLDVLENAAALRTLRIGDLRADGIGVLEDLPGLQRLTLAGDIGGDIDVVRKLEDLRELTLLDTGIENLDALEGLEKLEYLAVADSGVSDIDGIGGLARLKTLILAGAQAADIGAIAQPGGLEKLALLYMAIDDPDPLRSLEQLKVLCLFDVRFADEQVIAALEDEMGVMVYRRSSPPDPLQELLAAMELEPTPQPTQTPVPAPTPRPIETPGLGPSITTEYIPPQALPDLENPGAVPDIPYTIAISNGDMANEWRRAFWDDLSETGRKYAERFGMSVYEANSTGDTAQQVKDVQELLAMGPDMLLLSPGASAPLAVAGDMCEEAGVPYMTLDLTITREPGQGMYVCAVMMDGYEQGVRNGVRIVDDMIRKNGKPQGNIAEITGVLGASVSRNRSAGVRRVLADYPDIKVVISVPGDFQIEKSREAIRDILAAKPKGTIDGVLCVTDTTALAAVEQIKAAGRDELLGWIWAVDGIQPGLHAIIEGDIAEITECPPYMGLVAFEYAIQYLNGEQIPLIAGLPVRDFSGETPEKMELLKKIYRSMTDDWLRFTPPDFDSYLLMVPENAEAMDKYYPMHYWEQPDMEAWLSEFEAYTTE